jgi:hypothetical protein
MTTEPYKPRSLNDLFWWGAIGEAKQGYPERLAELLRKSDATPTPEAREYLASIIDGTQRAPIRASRTKIKPRLQAQMRSVIAHMEDSKAFGRMSAADGKRQKNALIAEIAATTGAKLIVVTKRWNEIAAEEEKRAKELVATVRKYTEPTPQRAVYRMGKKIKLESWGR